MATASRNPDRERNAARSRDLILSAAERLFAERGYEATSLSDVGQAAGVSRGTPGYFFGSKADLYRAVLERCFQEVRSAVLTGRERAERSGHDAEVVLAGAVSDYVDFIAARPNFVRLMQREALGDGPGIEGVPLGVAMGREMMSALSHELGLEGEDPTEVAHFLLSLVALTWFPHTPGTTFGRVIGLDADRPEFLDARKQHVTELLRAWLRAHRRSTIA